MSRLPCQRYSSILPAPCQSSSSVFAQRRRLSTEWPFLDSQPVSILLKTKSLLLCQNQECSSVLFELPLTDTCVQVFAALLFSTSYPMLATGLFQLLLRKCD